MEKEELISILKEVLYFFVNTKEKDCYGICRVIIKVTKSFQDYEIVNDFLIIEFRKLITYKSYHKTNSMEKFKKDKFGAYHFGTDKQRIKFLKNLIKKLEND